MNEKIKEVIYLSIMILFLVLFSLTIVSFYFINQVNSPFIISIFVKYHVLFMFSIAILGLLFGLSITDYIII